MLIKRHVYIRAQVTQRGITDRTSHEACEEALYRLLHIKLCNGHALIPAGACKIGAHGAYYAGVSALIVFAVECSGNVGVNKNHRVFQCSEGAHTVVYFQHRVVVAELAIHCRPAGAAHDDLSARDFQCAGGLREHLVVADEQTDAAELSLIDIQLMSVHHKKPLRACGMYLAVLADKALGADQHGCVIGVVRAYLVLLCHTDHALHIVLFGCFDESPG